MPLFKKNELQSMRGHFRAALPETVEKMVQLGQAGSSDKNRLPAEILNWR
jgi:hypothetical protein